MTITADTLVPDHLWQAIQPLLPPLPRRSGGRPRVDDRAALAGIVYQLRTGIPWRLLPTSHASDRSTTYRWRPSRWLDSMPRRAIRGVIPRARSALRQRG